MQQIIRPNSKPKSSKFGQALGLLEGGLALNSAFATKGGETPLQKLFKKKGSVEGIK